MDALFQIGLTVASILIVLWLESLRKPRLRLCVGEPGEIFPNDAQKRQPGRWTHVYVYNEPMPKWIAWAFNRDPALSCRGWITFHELGGADLFNRKMLVRWSNNPEPLLLDPQTGMPQGVDWDKMRTGHLWDIPPAALSDREYGVASVLFRANTDNDCYGFNNDSYLHGWRNPDWRLGPGQYLARIVVRTGGQLFADTFVVHNEGPYSGFRIVSSSRKL